MTERFDRGPTGFPIRGGFLLLTLGLVFPGCGREYRPFRPMPAVSEPIRWTSLSDLHPGPVPVIGAQGSFTDPFEHARNGYDETAYAISEGERLFEAYNCAGCHFHGGGGMGVPLMDDRWIYGERPEQIFATIVEGRPNGMPAWGGRIPTYQIWWLVAYVRSVGGLTQTGGAPGRSDHLEAGQPPNSKAAEKPVHSNLPKSAEMPK